MQEMVFEITIRNWSELRTVGQQSEFLRRLKDVFELLSIAVRRNKKKGDQFVIPPYKNGARTFSQDFELVSIESLLCIVMLNDINRCKRNFGDCKKKKKKKKENQFVIPP